MKNNFPRLLIMTFVFASGPGLWGQSQPGPLSATQKEHSKLYQYQTGKNLPQLAATGTGDILVEVARFPGYWVIPAGPHPPYPNLFLVDAAARADLVAIGVMKSSSSALTEEQNFIFTDWEMTVQEVLKNNPAAPIGVNSNVTVTQPGGTLVINGRNVRAIEGMFAPFRVGGRYLLFLYFIPPTGAYRAVNDKSFELFQNSVQKMTVATVHVDVKNRDPQSFVAEVRAAIAAKH